MHRWAKNTYRSKDSDIIKSPFFLNTLKTIQSFRRNKSISIKFIGSNCIEIEKLTYIPREYHVFNMIYGNLFNLNLLPKSFKYNVNIDRQQSWMGYSVNHLNVIYRYMINRHATFPLLLFHNIFIIYYLYFIYLERRGGQMGFSVSNLGGRILLIFTLFWIFPINLLYRRGDVFSLDIEGKLPQFVRKIILRIKFPPCFLILDWTLTVFNANPATLAVKEGSHYLFIYWGFTPLSTLFQLYHGDSSLIHDPWVNREAITPCFLILDWTLSI